MNIYRHPPLADFTPQKDPVEIVLPEDPFVKEVYKRHPELKYEAYE